MGSSGRARNEIVTARRQGTIETSSVKTQEQVHRKLVKTKRKKVRKPKRAPGERKYKRVEQREPAVLKRKRERLELAKRMKEELFLQAAVGTIAKTLMAGESGSEESPPSADDFESTITLNTGVPAAIVSRV